GSAVLASDHSQRQVPVDFMVVGQGRSNSLEAPGGSGPALAISNHNHAWGEQEDANDPRDGGNDSVSQGSVHRLSPRPSRRSSISRNCFKFWSSVVDRGVFSSSRMRD